jgi:tripartite-type tricarboxylate transporter receptor subunit TctC
MKLPRRNFLHLAAGAAALAVVSRFAFAQAYPSRPVRIIVGFAAGGPADIVARLIAQWLSERLGQQFVVENRTGAATNIATEAVVRAPADGYTLLFVTAASAINTTLYKKLNFNLSRDIVPVASLIRAPSVLEVNPSVPARVYRLCQGQSRQAHHGVGWDRSSFPCLRRAVQVYDRGELGACAL